MASYASIRTTTMLLGALLLAVNAHGQQTTNTNCTLSGNTANCTSNTTDYGAQQQRANEEGQQVGQAIGAPIGQAIYAARVRHAEKKWIKKHCAQYPGHDWGYQINGQIVASGHCPTEEEKAEMATHEFMAHHKDFKPCADNSKLMVAYIEAHSYDPREQKSYERAYKTLKKTGQLELYAK